MDELLALVVVAVVSLKKGSHRVELGGCLASGVTLVCVSCVIFQCRLPSVCTVFVYVQTGVGRTGAVWGYENLGVEPDVITSAKVCVVIFIIHFNVIIVVITASRHASTVRVLSYFICESVSYRDDSVLWSPATHLPHVSGQCCICAPVSTSFVLTFCVCAGQHKSSSS